MLLALVVVLLVCLALIPLGLPGLWLMIGATVGFDALGAVDIGTPTLVGVVALGVVAEGLEFVLAGRYTRKYGGSRRAGWAAIVGGFVGALVGVPVPIIGSVIGGFLGAFAGAFVAEWTRRDPAASPTRVATGAIVGRAAGAAVKVAAGLVILGMVVLG